MFTRPSGGASNANYIMEGRLLRVIWFGRGGGFFLCLGCTHRRRYRRMEVPWCQSH